MNPTDEVARKEVNNLNIELVHKLKDTDSAFSLGILLFAVFHYSSVTNVVGKGRWEHLSF